MAINLPQELFYQFALYLPSTKDVLTFALTHSCVRKALLTPALFKERLALRWDLSAWKDADDGNAAAQSPARYLERWMRIDYIYCKTVQLFDEAAVDNYFSRSSPVGGTEQSLDDVVNPHLPDQGPVPREPLLDEQKAFVWLRKLSEVLPVVLTHQRGGNILQIAESKYHGVLLIYARILSSICGIFNPKPTNANVSRSQALNPRPPASEYAWLERISFCLVALLIQCDAETVTSIFNDTVAYSTSPSSTYKSFWAKNNTQSQHSHWCILGSTQSHSADSDPYTLTVTIAQARQLHISDRHISTYLIQGMIFITLSLETSLPLRPPSIPYINPSVSFSCDDLFEVQRATSPSSFFLPPSQPWLKNRLAGTPLAELLSVSSEGDDSDGRRVGRRLWAGYYTYGDDKIGQDSPMFLELHNVQGPSSALPPNAGPDPSETIHFRGEGHDGVGAFTLRGSCESRMGAVTATKSYATHAWDWQGVVTPFGIAGIWGDNLFTEGGRWWIWPREWSNNPVMTE